MENTLRKGLSSGNTFLSRTGQSWKLEPTYNVWSLMPLMSSLSHDHMSALALEIDTTSSNAEMSPELSYGDRTLCCRWRNVIEGLDDDHVYHIIDLMTMFLLTYEDDFNRSWFAEGLLQRATMYIRNNEDPVKEVLHG